jgi:2-polyprenyl-3-methyl-5-hydroxy-6-metoxy-1,4-benzoquinol methylase
MKRAIKRKARIFLRRQSQMASQLARALFYRFVFGRKMPFAGKLTAIVSAWEQKTKKGGIPLDQEVWEAQYLIGKWNFLNQPDELARYSVIIAYLQFFKPKGAVLDVGCGEGILWSRYRPYGYTRYVGLDISHAAIEKLCPEQDAQTHFLVVDAERYVPQERFDVIVFNEVLYYFHDALEVVRRYTQALQDDGIVVVSTYAGSARALSILRQVKTKLFLLDEVKITHGAQAWLCSVFTPSKTAWDTE